MHESKESTLEVVSIISWIISVISLLFFILLEIITTDFITIKRISLVISLILIVISKICDITISKKNRVFMIILYIVLYSLFLFHTYMVV